MDIDNVRSEELYSYKQVRPSAAHSAEMCVTMDSKKLLTCHCIALCKAPISFPPQPPATRHRNAGLLGSVLPRFRGLGKGIS